MSSHVYHEGLEHYKPDAVLQDGCPVCEGRAVDLRGLLNLDQSRIRKLWELTVAFELTNPPAKRPQSAADANACHLLYSVAVLLERFGIDPKGI